MDSLEVIEVDSGASNDSFKFMVKNDWKTHDPQCVFIAVIKMVVIRTIFGQITATEVGLPGKSMQY